MSIQKTSLISLAALAIALGTQTTAFAQTSAIDAIEDVVRTTATRKADAENVQDIPIAVTAFNSDSLEALKVRSLESLSFSAPNVSLDDVGTARGTANFSIRGLGVNSSIASIDPTVGVFVDGVYLGINSGVVFDVFDLDSVEVLRGPQGILFGRNTTGGAVLLNTGNPTDELEYKARFAVEGPVDGGRGGVNTFAQGVMSGPIIDGAVNGKVALYYNNDEGYFKNLATGNNHGAAKTYILRGALDVMFNESVNSLIKFEYFNSKGDGPSAQNRGLYERDSFDFAIDEEGFYEGEAISASVTTTWDVGFGDGQFTNIFGYRETSSSSRGDIDATPLFLFHAPAQLEQDQISNEIRYNGTFGKFDLTTGIYLFRQNVALSEQRLLPSVTPLTFSGGGFQEHTVLGAFASVDYEVTDRLTASAGVRFSEEDKDGGVGFIIPRATTCGFVAVPRCPTSGPTGFSDSRSFSNWSPRANLTYDVTDNALVYGTYSRGYRSGGFNFRITDPVAFANQVADTGSPTFDEEKVDNFEIGTKFSTEDNRGTLNLAAFYTDISDFQREVNVAGGAGVSQFILNTAEATIKGFEAEGRYRVMDNLLLTGNFGYIDAEYDEIFFDISGDGVVSDADLALSIPRVPETTFGVGFIHEIDLGNDTNLTSRFNFQHRDRIAYTDNNFGFIQAADMLDGNITWNTPVEGVSLSLYGKNLLDQVQAGGDTQLPFGSNVSAFIPGSQALGNGVNVPFDNNPAVGTFSPLKKGRLIGVELTIRG